MSQKKVADLFNKEYAAMGNKIPQYIGVSNTSNIVDVTWRTDQVVNQFIVALKELLEPFEKAGDLQEGFVKNSVTKASLNSSVTKVIKNVKAGGGTYPKALQLEAWQPTKIKPGNFFLRRAKGGVGLTFRFISGGKGRGTGANDTRIQNVAFAMRDAIYTEWSNNAGRLFNKLPKTGRGPGGRRTKAQGIITKHTQQAHEKNTTKGALMVGLLKELRPEVDLTFQITTLDVIEQIESNIQLDYGRNFKKGKIGKYSFRYFIETSIRKNKAGTEETDISTIKEKQTKRAVNDIFVERHGRIGALLRKLDGSIPPDTQIAEDSILEIVRPLTKSGKPDKRFKINKKLSARQFKKYSDKFEGKRAKGKTGIKMSTATVGVPGTISRRPQKRKRDEAQNLLKIEALINKRLPAEVRRNMGRPALINQTGRFSNSAEVQNLRQTKAGISGEYTYQLSPYETFENTGGRRWPSGYNPKPLIAKSIRNLAIQYTEQKLVSLRRT